MIAEPQRRPPSPDDRDADEPPTHPGAGPEPAHDRLVAPSAVPAAIEAVLLTLDKPVTTAKLAAALGLDADDESRSQVEAAIDDLNQAYEDTGRAFRIHPVAGGHRLMTLPEFAGPVAAIKGMRDSGKLSKPALEALAIVAYEQPVTRARIEAIRGVACGEVLKTLLERRLLAIVGRAEEIGRPMLYGTTKAFLEAFGLPSIKDLPSIGDVLAPPKPAGGQPPSQPAE